MTNLDICYAFARGYYDARANGTESNPYNGHDQGYQHQAYGMGYEWGISDYQTIEQGEGIQA